jgi:hypothetical protein
MDAFIHTKWSYEQSIMALFLQKTQFVLAFLFEVVPRGIITCAAIFSYHEIVFTKSNL